MESNVIWAVWLSAIFCSTHDDVAKKDLEPVLLRAFISAAVFQDAASVLAISRDLDDEFFVRRIVYLDSLAKIAAPAISDIVRITEHGNVFQKRACVRLLGRLRCCPNISVPALRRALNDPSPGVPHLASIALAKFGIDEMPRSRSKSVSGAQQNHNDIGVPYEYCPGP